MTEPTDIKEALDRTVTRALMTGVALTKPAWESVPVDPCEPTGEMKNVVSTDVTPLRDHIAAALSPLLNRVRAEALREVAVVIDAFSGTCLNASSAADIITATADRIEQNSEGNET